jgi:NAD-dependent dihydropyrimidine dehydrogenase PreA subunit
MASGTYMNIPQEKIPWYPVIDEDLCTNCGNCLEFCSNGVFAATTSTQKWLLPTTAWSVAARARPSASHKQSGSPTRKNWSPFCGSSDLGMRLRPDERGETPAGLSFGSPVSASARAVASRRRDREDPNHRTQRGSGVPRS